MIIKRLFSSKKVVLGVLALPVLVGAIAAVLFLGQWNSVGTTGASVFGQVEGQDAGLDEDCTISILNRTARVSADGSWRIDNVPANLGQVRARVTCIRDGQTLSGQSGFFDIVANAINGFDQNIPLGEFDSAPASLVVTADPTILTALPPDPAGTTQLTATATFPDLTTEDVTAAAAGTNYTTSNPAIADVGPNGLVTAVTSGTVIVSASNEGAIGILNIRVVLSGDTDGDGIPDDVELANGLDPNTPVDALEDPDLDALTNFDELVTHGTDHLAFDTDGDGLSDGEELFAPCIRPGPDGVLDTAPGGDDVVEGVNIVAGPNGECESAVAGDDLQGFDSSPLLPDTDGDGLRDGLEAQLGSDPGVANDVMPAGALASLDVTPDNSVLTFNTIFGEVSIQLTVTGTLIDGFPVDLTSTLRGTNYASSDLGVCNFGAVPGQVFAGEGGVEGTLCAVEITNTDDGGNPLSATANIVVRTFPTTALTSIALPNNGYANNVDMIDDNFAYVAAGAAGLQVIDVSDAADLPNLPPNRIVGSLDTPGTAIDIKIVGTLAYIADGDSGLQIMDVTDPTAPSLVGSVDTPGIAQDLVVSDDRAYIADGASGLTIINVSDPANPSVITTLDTPGTAKGVDVSGNPDHALVADGSPGASSLQVIDITDENNPAIVGSVAIPGDAKDLTVRDPHAYVAAFTGGFQVVDFSTPAAPAIVGSIPQAGGFVPRDVALSGQFALAAEQLFPNAIPFVNISDPTDPIFVITMNLSPLGDFAGTGIAVTRRFVYVTEENFVVSSDFKATGNTRLFIGQYLAIDDTGGIPPVVNITSPLPGDEVILGSGPIPVTVEATDDVLVAAVDLLANGVVVGTDANVPFEFNLPVPLDLGPLTIGATAIDLGNNIGVAPDVVVNVIPDPLTTVIGRVLDEAGAPVAGADVGTLGHASVTDGAGVFALGNVPTIQGDIRVSAEALIDGQTVFGRSLPVPPVRGGTTDVGDITVRPADLKFSATIGSLGVTGSGVREAELTDQVPTSIFQVLAGGNNLLLLEGLDLGVRPETGQGGEGGLGAQSVGGDPSQDSSIDAPEANPVAKLEGEKDHDDFPEQGNVTSLAVLEDGSFLFNIGERTQGVEGSAVEARRGEGLRHADIFASDGTGNNTLFLAGDQLGIEDFSNSFVDALALLPDDSVIFSTDPDADGDGVIEDFSDNTRGMNIYRSFKDGSNELFASAAQLGLLPVQNGDIDGLVWSGEGFVLFSVVPGTQGLPGTGVEAAEGSPTLDSDIFLSRGDGTNELFLDQTDLGLSGSGVDALAFRPAPTEDGLGVPPTVDILDLAPGAEIIEGDMLVVRASVSDDVAVKLATVTVGATGTAAVDFPFSPVDFPPVFVPLILGPLNVTVEAADLADNLGTDTVAVTVIPDPLTTVVGRVVDLEAVPVAGAEVAVFGEFTATTGLDGTFTIPNVPTIRGPIVISANGFVDAEPASGKSAAVDPVRDGVTDVGDVVIIAGAVVGYYSLSSNQGVNAQVQPILTAGFDAVNVGDLNAADLSEFNILFVQNPSNGSFGATWPANLQKVSDFVAGGGVLIMHDRQVGNAEANLPGDPGNIVRETGAGGRIIDVLDDTTCVTNGPGGVVNDATLDGGNLSNHGFTLGNTIPAGGSGILSRTDPNQLVTFSYPFGAGHVIYSSIPLDFYLGGGSAFATIYAPNVICYAQDLRVAGLGGP